MGLHLLSSKQRDAHQILKDTMAALDRSQALIEFKPDGSVIRANDKFLAALGYSLLEVEGKHHSMFVEPEYAKSEEYNTFWSNLQAGQHQTAQFKRIGKDGREVWIEASYNPLIGRDGSVYRVVKNAIDVTQQYHEAADAKGQLAAISRSQAVIEFSLDGIITATNQNFCQALGYSANEIIGRHHSMFVRPDDVATEAYREFWTSLARGEFHAAEFLRIGKGGREVWIQASYNPIFDASGRPFKVVKYATDVTARKTAVNSMGEALARLANGDLTCAINQAFPPDLESVRQSFNATIQQFGKMVSELRQTSSALRGATGEILSGANDLADRTTKQAAAIEETSAAVEQLSETVKLNAQRAHTAGISAQAVSSEAELTGQTMEQANLAMAEVTNQSNKISGIIGLIDDIAFQTNLLALNASVEAARAGDAGKGFAVVAVEVRRLAQSAASASKDVKGLIEQSGEAVALGSKLVAEATDRLSGMVGGVQENARIMGEIAVDSSEQANALTEVNTAVREMDEMTQHNAALVEEINAAIEQTESQASKVDSLIEVFNFGGSHVPAHASPIKKTARVSTAKTYVVGSNVMKADWDEF